MFNDPLSLEDCTVLLERLAKCAFPFQCAHGRPSMAPVLDLGSGASPGSALGGKTEPEGGFLLIDEFRRWTRAERALRV